jgi:hypothetical protein
VSFAPTDTKQIERMIPMLAMVPALLVGWDGVRVVGVVSAALSWSLGREMTSLVAEKNEYNASCAFGCGLQDFAAVDLCSGGLLL